MKFVQKNIGSPMKSPMKSPMRSPMKSPMKSPLKSPMSPLRATGFLKYKGSRSLVQSPRTEDNNSHRNTSNIINRSPGKFCCEKYSDYWKSFKSESNAIFCKGINEI